MSGVKVPLSIAAPTAVVASHVAKGTLPFTGVALGLYLAVGGGLVLTGLCIRLLARAK
jgi:hypothetical protein